MNNYTSIFRVGLLDDLHNYFPELLYNSNRFQSVQDVLRYIQDQAKGLSPFERGQRMYTPPVPVNQVITPSYTPISVEDNRRQMDISHNPVPIQTPPSRSQRIPYPPVIRRAPSIRYTTDSFFNDDNLIGINSLANLFTVALNQPFSGMTDVPIVPTPDEVNNATSIVTATQAEECVICQENMELDVLCRRITRCRHMFHRPCIDTWFQSNVTCPICRIDIRD